VVAHHPSGFFDLAAAPRQPLDATTLPTSPRKTRVGVFRHRSSGQTSARRRCRSMFTPGSRPCVYKTVSGRHEWLNQDPIGERGGINLYDYVANNPINWIDPLGLSHGPGGWAWGWWDIVTFYPHAFYDLGYAIQDAPGKWNDAFKKAEEARKKKEDELNNDYSDSKCHVPSKANDAVNNAFQQGIGNDIGDIISDVPGTSFTGDVPSVGEHPGYDLIGTAVGGTVPGSMESDPAPKSGK
jgi:hypothetical protein